RASIWIRVAARMSTTSSRGGRRASIGRELFMENLRCMCPEGQSPGDDERGRRQRRRGRRGHGGRLWTRTLSRKNRSRFSRLSLCGQDGQDASLTSTKRTGAHTGVLRRANQRLSASCSLLAQSRPRRPQGPTDGNRTGTWRPEPCPPPATVASTSKYRTFDARTFVRYFPGMARWLTSKQRTVLEVVERSWRERGMAPSVADVAEAIEVGRSTAYQHLVALKKKGFVDHEEGTG